MFDFTPEQLHRYSRHILLKEIGVEGQEKLCRAKVLIVGAGGLGSPAAMYLAAAGVGTLGIINNDRVELSNLQRQILHRTADIDRPKVDSASESMLGINPEIRVKPLNMTFSAENAIEIIQGYDFVVDGTDNFFAKFLVNDACVIEGIPFSHAGVLGFAGQAMTVIPGKSTCYRCVFRQPPSAGSVSTCSQAGVLGAVAGIFGTIQAAEAVKFITGAGELLVNTLLTIDALTMHVRKVPLLRQDNCTVCGINPVITEPVDVDQEECT